MKDLESARAAIDSLVGKFFEIFDNRDNKVVQLRSIEELCIEQAIFIKNCDDANEIHNLGNFIKPRQKLLTDGELSQFSEQEISSSTKIFAGIAQRFCVYKKSGFINNVWFEHYGKKSFQLVKVKQHWYIASVTWNDESQANQIENEFKSHSGTTG